MSPLRSSDREVKSFAVTGSRGSTWLWTAMVAIALLAVFIRLCLVFGRLSGHPPELLEYDEIARNLLSGQGYVYTHLHVPYRSYYAGVPYIWMTAGLYALFPPGYTAVLVAQAIIAALLAVVVFLIGRMVCGDRAGLIAAFLTATHPAFIYYDTHKLHPLGVDTLMACLAVLMLLRARRSSHGAVAWVAGVVLGVACLQRGSLLPFLPLALLWLWRLKQPRQRALSFMLASLMGTVLVISPWVVRNWRLHGSPGMLTTGGEHLWVGNAPQSLGSALLPSGERVIDRSPPALMAKVFAAQSEVEQSKLFFEATIESVRANPWATACKMLWKFVTFWTFAPQTGVLYPKSYLHLYAAYYVLMVALAIWGLFWLAQTRIAGFDTAAGLLLILALFASVSSIHALYYSELRHRWGIEPLLLVLSAAGIQGIRQAVRTHTVNTSVALPWR